MADILFDIGLCHHSITERPKRKAIDKPIIISVIVWVYMIERIASIIISDHNNLALMCLGDVGRYWRIKIHLSLIFIIVSLIAITSQLNYYYGYKRAIESTFVRVFHIMSDKDKAVDFGIYRRSDVKKLMQYKIIFRIIRQHNRIVAPLVGILFVFISYMINESVTSTLLFGTPNSVFIGLYGYYKSNVLIFQFAYFYFVCKYLKLKLNGLNTELKFIQNNKRFARIPRILRSFDALYREIDEYNVTYWSKYLLIIWVLWGAVTVLFIYLVVFGDTFIIVRILMFYATLLGIIIFNFVFPTTCSLNYKANKTYTKLNSLYLGYITAF